MTTLFKHPLDRCAVTAAAVFLQSEASVCAQRRLSTFLGDDERPAHRKLSLMLLNGDHRSRFNSPVSSRFSLHLAAFPNAPALAPGASVFRLAPGRTGECVIPLSGLIPPLTHSSSCIGSAAESGPSVSVPIAAEKRKSHTDCPTRGNQLRRETSRIPRPRMDCCFSRVLEEIFEISRSILSQTNTERLNTQRSSHDAERQHVCDDQNRSTDITGSL